MTLVGFDKLNAIILVCSQDDRSQTRRFLPGSAFPERQEIRPRRLSPTTISLMFCGHFSTGGQLSAEKPPPLPHRLTESSQSAISSDQRKPVIFNPAIISIRCLVVPGDDFKHSNVKEQPGAARPGQRRRGDANRRQQLRQDATGLSVTPPTKPAAGSLTTAEDAGEPQKNLFQLKSELTDQPRTFIHTFLH